MSHRLYDVDAGTAEFEAILEWSLGQGADTMLFVVRTPFESGAVDIPGVTPSPARLTREFVFSGRSFYSTEE